jgi:hypothetical protein
MSGIPSRFKSEMESHMSAEVKREREEEENNVTPRSRRRKVARKAKATAVKSDVDEVKAGDVEARKEVVVKEEVDNAKNEGPLIKVEENMIVKVEEDVGIPDTTIKLEGDATEGDAAEIKEEVEEGWDREEREERIANTTYSMIELLRRGFGGRGGWRRITAKQRACESFHTSCAYWT